MTRADGSLVRYELDDLGRTIGIRSGLTAQTPEGGNVIGLGYDTLDRTTSVTPPGQGSHGFTMDAWGGVGTYTPPSVAGVAHPETVTARGGDGEVVRADLPYASGSAPTNTAAYDSTTGRFASPYVTVNGRSGSFVPRYDSVGRIDRWTTPEGNSVTVGFDGGRVQSTTWAGAVAGSVTYGYTNVQLTSLTLAGGTGTSAVLNLGYDNDDLLTSVGTSANPLTLYRTANAMGANDPLGTDAMTADNGLLRGTSIVGTAAVRSSTRWSPRGLPSAEATTWSDGNARRYGFDYQYDSLGRITTRNTYEDSTLPTHVDTYGYDAYGRLEVVTRDGVESERYGYDANGNRTSATLAVGPSVTSEQVVVDAQDRLLQYGGLTYTYNPLGQRQTRTENGSTTSYTYDALGNLLAVDLPGGSANELTYVVDAAGRRIARKKNGTLERAWLYQNGLEPVAELEASGAITAVFVYGTKPHVPDLVIRGGVTYRVITDHLGSVRRVVNTTTGAVAQAFEYDAWGRITSSSCNGVATCEDLQPFRYAGGLYDRDTGLTRFGARDYDAEIGRWTAKDPIGFGGGDSNVYAYVGGDPVNGIDPTGLLFDGLIDAGEGYGDSAAKYWADVYENSSGLVAAGAALMGGMASLWTPCTSDKTVTTLGAAYAINGYVGRSFWRYVGQNARPDGRWLTRGRAWSAPYGRDFTAAKDALQLPATPTDVIKVPSRWNEFIIGPRTVSGNPQWGAGGGIEYFRGLWFP